MRWLYLVKKRDSSCIFLFLKLERLRIVASSILLYTIDGPWLILFHIILCQTPHLFSSCKIVQSLVMSQASSLFSSCWAHEPSIVNDILNVKHLPYRQISNILVADRMASQRHSCPIPWNLWIRTIVWHQVLCRFNLGIDVKNRQIILDYPREANVIPWAFKSKAFLNWSWRDAAETIEKLEAWETHRMCPCWFQRGEAMWQGI